MSEYSNDRREFLGAGLALGALALTPAAGAADAPPAAAPAGLTTAPASQAGTGPRLTMHAIDTFHGSPGAAMRVDLSFREGDTYKLIKSFTTNKGGRTDDPLLVAEGLKAGRYELLLYVGEYFTKLGAKLPTPGFLDQVPIRFAVADAGQRYHIPILFSPWSYSYYRGS